MNKEHKEFLDRLREIHGETNMFGAGQFLQREFGLDKRGARAILAEWMNNSKEELPYVVYKGKKYVRGFGLMEYKEK